MNFVKSIISRVLRSSQSCYREVLSIIGITPSGLHEADKNDWITIDTIVVAGILLSFIISNIYQNYLIFFEALGAGLLYFAFRGALWLAKLAFMGQGFNKYFKGYLRLCDACEDDLVTIVHEYQGFTSSEKDGDPAKQAVQGLWKYTVKCDKCGYKNNLVDHLDSRLTKWNNTLEIIGTLE